jgi:hypothetical protein
MEALEDFKISISMAKGKLLTFFLAIIGIFVVLGIIFVVITLPIGLIAWFMNPSIDFISQWVNAITAWTIPLTGGSLELILSFSFIAFVLPGVSFFVWILGALFGISKEYIETGDTRVENVFIWLRKKFFPLIITGVLISVIILLPAMVVGYLVSAAYGFGDIPFPVDVGLWSIALIYAFIIIGFISFWVPAVCDDVSPIDALKKSIELVKNNLIRVFGFLAIIVIILVIFITPIAFYSYYLISLGQVPNPMTDAVLAALIAWIVFGAFLFLLLLLPATILGLTRIYNEIK